ncbi:MAG: hypothetical protein AAFV53_11170 [Myxococcota bacterium]
MLWWIALLGCGPPGERSQPFYVGVNYPWRHYGIDFGTTAWGDLGVENNAAAIDADFAMLADHGIEAVRWFLLADGRAAPTFDADGTPIGIDPDAMDDLEMALTIADDHGVQILWVLTDFHWCAPQERVDGVVLGDHADAIRNRQKRQRLMEDVFRPILATFGDHPSVLGWEVMNEPEWAIKWDWIGETPMIAFVEETAALIAEETDRPSTVGSASIADMGALWADRNLDWLQYHDYSWLRDHPPASMVDDMPVLLGEVPTANGDLAGAMDAAWERDYLGAWGWSLNGDDEESDLDLSIIADWGPPR